ncbi:hypothetical protein NDU88_007988 [Pleurodeles waltl]|uniref:Uncharacterized protein n=1 Tax=Pleurodeles waltl TaxID=8319 RepID=A0AAV7QNN2_PLEWA|nr:hypothetical protein NDU88_007988 [Pleurodeles waltl]
MGSAWTACPRLTHASGSFSRSSMQEAIVCVLTDYLEFNWQSATTKALGWEALKAVMRGACMGVTCGVQRQLDTTLGAQECKLAVLQGSEEKSQVCHEMIQMQRKEQFA